MPVKDIIPSSTEKTDLSGGEIMMYVLDTNRKFAKGFSWFTVDYIKDDTAQKAEDLCYAYRLNGSMTDDDLKDIIKDFEFNYKDVTDKYYLETVGEALPPAVSLSPTARECSSQ